MSSFPSSSKMCTDDCEQGKPRDPGTIITPTDWCVIDHPHIIGNLWYREERSGRRSKPRSNVALLPDLAEFNSHFSHHTSDLVSCLKSGFLTTKCTSIPSQIIFWLNLGHCQWKGLHPSSHLNHDALDALATASIPGIRSKLDTFILPFTQTLYASKPPASQVCWRAASPLNSNLLSTTSSLSQS